ncbi:LysR family transcriptional regulator [Vitiosangium sp. GDMCC 1.1324]|uniref:LysR family transcriptional regulator n=1 Tax=Vitiosangium sp. (strain GDMCC 1.1324) TaxID=2138576 RepID=UPI000D3AC6F5|nr:LysR family transcriptional regulator [Vitiosangium sp. GDMCC 1.1324]PTL76769.1 LysR family transcriptional regulator [Vitiosangium sp. GDMCC 1.1324]
MDRLETLRVFVAVAEEAGFASAARRLAMSPPAVTRAVAALEERIGTRLLHRTTRIVRLTEAGTRFLADCKRILGELEEAEASAAGSHTEPRGQLGVTASMMFGRMFVAPILLDFLARHPHVIARTLLVDRVVDLVDEGLDVAIRIAHLADSSLSAVRVGSVRRVVCASPRYLAKHGIPRTPAELSRFDAFMFSSTAAQQAWSFASGARNQTVSPPTRLIVNTAEVAIAAAVAGRGLTRVLSYQIAPELLAGQLRIVLEDFEPPPLPIHVVYPEGRRANARVRAFVDFAVDRLRAEKSLNP